MRRHRRFLGFLLGGCVIAILAGPASAATPGFEFTIRTDGSTVHVEVDFEPVPAGFAWAQLEAAGVPDRLVGVLPADQVDGNGRPNENTEPILLSLERTEVGVYDDSINLPEGRWALVAWPLIPDFQPEFHPGAASTEFVTVGGTSIWMWIAGGAIVGLVAVGALRRLRSGEPSS